MAQLQVTIKDAVYASALATFPGVDDAERLGRRGVQERLSQGAEPRLALRVRMQRPRARRWQLTQDTQRTLGAAHAARANPLGLTGALHPESNNLTCSMANSRRHSEPT